MIDKADTTWMLVATALVMLMTPALAFFYGGLVRKKNVLSVLMQTFIILAVISIQWIFFGYSLSFGSDIGGVIGGLEMAFLNGVGVEPLDGQTIPHQLFMMFQMMFAVITPALIIGAFAERAKFSGMLIFVILWSTLVYDPMVHMVWGGGLLGSDGALDFAGGTVIHITAGITALVMVLMMGRRIGSGVGSSPHSLPLAVLGAGVLWFGWFGFNAGSQLAVDGVTVSALVNTHAGAAAGAAAWMILDWRVHKIPTVLGVITGIVAGLVAITPAAGFVTPISSIAIGAGGSVFAFIFVVYVKSKFGYDDSLDVFGVHGIAGIWGALATGLFATKTINPNGADGLFYGNPGQLLIQTKAVIVAIVLSIVVTVVLYKIIDLLVGMRVSERDENIGLDLTAHHETGYTMMD